MILNKLLIIALLLVYVSDLSAWQIMQGNAQTRDGNTSFSFPIKSLVGHSERLFAFAHESNKDQAKEYAISVFDYNKNQFEPAATKEIKVDGKEKQDNPLYDQPINFLATIDDLNTAVILQSKPTLLYDLCYLNGQEILSSGALKDATSNPIDQPIIALAGARSCAFAAIKGQGQETFGTSSSAIALIAFKQEEKEEELSEQDYEKIKAEVQASNDENMAQAFSKQISTDKQGKHKKKVITKTFNQLDAASFCVSSDCIKIGNDAIAIDDAVDMHWNENLKRLFIAICVKGNEQSTNGACGLIVARVNEKGKLAFSPFIAPNLVNDEHNQIIAGKGCRAQISIHKVCSMLTTTTLDYVIVLGGNGAPDNTKTTVFALPVLNFHNKDGTINVEHIARHGTIANTKGHPLEAFSDTGRSHLFLGRHFATVPESAADLPTNETVATQVGSGALGIGPIDTIFVQDDAVYAIVNHPFKGKSAGIYYSQAIFDAEGRIAAWSAWQPKVISDDDTIINAYVDRIRGSLIVAAGDDAHSVKTIKRTRWTLTQLTHIVQEQFPQSHGGVHGIASFSSNTPGLDGHSALAILGYGKIMFAETDDPLQITTFTSDVLHKLGPLNAAEIAFNYPFGWLIAGGAYGLAVLCNEDGTGWYIGNLDDSFLNLSKTMQFKRIGDYRFVRKIIADEQFLYILTDTSFDCIDLSLSDFSTGRLYTTHLADTHQFDETGLGIFIDAIVSEKCAILATISGLYRIGNGQDIRQDDDTTINWTRVPIHDGAGPVVAMATISITGRAQDVARGPGQLYVVTGSTGAHSARLHRYAIENVINRPISNSTIKPLRDFLAENHQSYFANIGNFSSLFATDGTLFFTQGMQRRKKMKTQVINNSFGRNRRAMPLALEPDAVITCITRDYGSGAWMVGGDFGLIVNE